MKNPIATMLMRNGKKVIIELFPNEAPNTINCFIDLANKGVYDNREIKRIVPGFVLQPTYDSFDRDPVANVAVNGEFRENGFSNNLKLEKGVVAIGGDGKTMAGPSCFYFVLSDEAGKKLDGKFPGIGRVIEGYEEIERIENIETKSVDIGVPGVVVNEPVVPEIIESITIETFGVTYDAPIISGLSD